MHLESPFMSGSKAFSLEKPEMNTRSLKALMRCPCRIDRVLEHGDCCPGRNHSQGDDCGRQRPKDEERAVDGEEPDGPPAQRADGGAEAALRLR